MKTLLCACLLGLTLSVLTGHAETPEKNAAKPMDKCIEILRKEFNEQKGWVKVHAAEALIDLDSRDFVRAGWKAEREEAWTDSIKVGFWRVSARCAETPAERARWIERIEKCFADESSPFRLTALESLCKLSFHPRGDTLQKLKTVASDVSKPDATFAFWALKLAGESDMDRQIAEILQSPDPKLQKLAAFSLNGARGTDPAALLILAAAADQEPADSVAAPLLLSAALNLQADSMNEVAWLGRVREILARGDGNSRYVVCQILARRFTGHELDVLEPVLQHPDPDARIGAALAIASIQRKADQTRPVAENAGFP